MRPLRALHRGRAAGRRRGQEALRRDRAAPLTADRFRDWPRATLELPGGGEIEVHVADRLGRRMLGLSWLGEPPELGLLIPRCDSVHTIGMRFAIDVAFLAWPPPDEAGSVAVLDVRAALRPMRLATLPLRGRPVKRSGIAAVELPAGRAAELGIAPGVELTQR